MCKNMFKQPEQPLPAAPLEPIVPEDEVSGAVKNTTNDDDLTKRGAPLSKRKSASSGLGL